ncbi:MAG: hypothetical protein KatS3mg111_3051 [Pirellulaceae bacterium]|nr:MAG: hypothetical protein KatS3mg111_3051 [Pirellulaceae bacterium]
MATIGILLVGHGTRSATGQEQFRRLATAVAERVAPRPLQPAFLELAQPDIPRAMEALAGAGVHRVLVVPALLFTAGHALRDIPCAVEEAAGRYGLEMIGATRPLEFHRSTILASIECWHAAQAVKQRSGWAATAPARSAAAGESAGRASEQSLGDSAARLNVDVGDGDAAHEPHTAARSGPVPPLLLVGRGSSHAAARATFRRWAEARAAAQHVDRWQIAFLHGGRPDWQEGLEWLAAQPGPLAVVQPHLLFHGQLIEQITQQLRDASRQYPEKQWLVAPPLGPHPALAQAFTDLIDEALATNAVSGA